MPRQLAWRGDCLFLLRGMFDVIVGHRRNYTVPQGYIQTWAEVRGRQVEPFSIVRQEVEIVSERLRHSVSTGIPALKTAAEYFFRHGMEGKRLRPSLVLLMSSALSPAVPPPEYLQVDLRPAAEHAPELRRRQQRIAEIAELIHVASLLHDDVIDDAETRRGVVSLNNVMGNKTAILAGDFLLARASVSLAALRNSETVVLMSQVLEHLVSGEIMQMTATSEQLLDLDHYLAKTYCKTASLMANSSRSIAVLAGVPPEHVCGAVCGSGDVVCDMAWSYGRHLGLAFQVVDDLLDLTGSSSVLGKPALNDLRSGLATAPVLFAAQEEPELRPLILRRFKQEGDVALAMTLIQRTQGLRRAEELAAHHAKIAADMIRCLPVAQSDHAEIAREALIQITHKVLTRKK
ncbi:hypothetical protein VOLCADRAFT_88541 [Volvox carteri f. nagariensis]|uniref:Uncharacterized protein n=1 Tax=Volvox carteri f. nagariensis TaxID=3068 RepID=D8TPA0_VOLCA|nr:uncharacterized protein VOLCADRAFT_88541 [Volvox carteri f. nagariensis]EFJ50585.1 hypothetical protein VOLCADRAFT_88541 [Volvox carteri f. nagariensis]|eukprot:XP_002948178.1 hypothetical protein VOLCADRAFT_88541 [Volvox carteri f. nagariensis]